MDKYYGNVCELDIIFNFQKAYFILDELLLAGEMQESSKKNVLRCISQQDSWRTWKARTTSRDHSSKTASYNHYGLHVRVAAGAQPCRQVSHTPMHHHKLWSRRTGICDSSSSCLLGIISLRSCAANRSSALRPRNSECPMTLLITSAGLELLCMTRRTFIQIEAIPTNPTRGLDEACGWTRNARHCGGSWHLQPCMTTSRNLSSSTPPSHRINNSTTRHHADI
ncbi:hypothetical protein MRB53_038116 [Persea americana]|nr:hypothetical protein MRB53_038116 [Persea americana]